MEEKNCTHLEAFISVYFLVRLFKQLIWYTEEKNALCKDSALSIDLYLQSSPSQIPKSGKLKGS